MYDLEERTFNFALRTKRLARDAKKSLINMDDIKQLIRSTGSVGANYIEANEALSKKDFKMRIRICIKEAKESCFWLKLLLKNDNWDQELKKECQSLYQEAEEIRKILASILVKSQ